MTTLATSDNAASYGATVIFTATATSDGLSVEQSFSWTVTPSLTVVNDAYTLLHDTTAAVAADVGVLANDSTTTGQPITATLTSGPSDGSLTLNADGSFIYTPNAGYTGSDSFQYTASDGYDSATATATLTITDQAPTATDQSFSTLHDQPLSVDATSGLLTGSTDADGDPLTVVTTPVVAPQYGTLTLNADGSFVYVPNPGDVGSDSFEYETSDGALASVPATVSLTVTEKIKGDIHHFAG